MPCSQATAPRQCSVRLTQDRRSLTWFQRGSWEVLLQLTLIQELRVRHILLSYQCQIKRQLVPLLSCASRLICPLADLRKCALHRPCSGTHDPSPLLTWLDHGWAPTYGWPNQWQPKIEMAWLKKMSQDKSVLSGKSRIGSGKTGPIGHWRWKCSYGGAIMLAESWLFYS